MFPGTQPRCRTLWILYGFGAIPAAHTWVVTLGWWFTQLFLPSHQLRVLGWIFGFCKHFLFLLPSFKFKCRKNAVCGSVFLCYSLILGFAKFAAFPNISKRKTSMMSPQKFCYSNCYCLGFSLLNASLTSSQLLCYLPLVSVFKASHCVLFASSPFLLFIFISSHAISWWWFLDSLLMAPFCLGWSHLITFSVMPPRTQLL